MEAVRLSKSQPIDQRPLEDANHALLLLKHSRFSGSGVLTIS